MKYKLIVMSLLLWMTALDLYASVPAEDAAFAGCNDAYRYVNDQFPIGSRHSYLMHNHTGIQQPYDVVYTLCDDKGVCERWGKTIVIAPSDVHGTREVLLKLNSFHNTPGTYPFKVTTDVVGEHSIHAEAVCNEYVVKRD